MPYSKDISVKKYIIEKNDEIILYGFNLYCKEQVDKLKESGYTVVGIVDKNLQGKDSYHGIQIAHSIENFSLTEKTCIFIMLQNGMQHWEIARDFYRYGICRVVFLPMKTGFYNDDIQNEFIVQYNYMMEGSYSFMRVSYLQDEMFEVSNTKSWRVAKQMEKGEYVIWVNKDMIRTTVREAEKYRDIPIADFIPYIDLFLFLAGDKRDISEYIRMYGFAPFPETSEEAYDYVIQKRKRLYDFFEDKFRSGNMDYFTAAAPKAVWNTSGCLNLCEGQHRCVYLLTKGMDYLPVRVDQTVIDYMEQGRMDKQGKSL